MGPPGPSGGPRDDGVVPPPAGCGKRTLLRGRNGVVRLRWRPRRLPAREEGCQRTGIRVTGPESPSTGPGGRFQGPIYTQPVPRVPRCVAGVPDRFIGSPRREGGEKPPRTRRRDRPGSVDRPPTRIEHATAPVLQAGPDGVGRPILDAWSRKTCPNQPARGFPRRAPLAVGATPTSGDLDAW